MGKSNTFANENFDVCIIGAGAAGLTAAIFAAEAGERVLVLEHTALSGKKLLSTGNGKCNFSNEKMTADCFCGEERAFVMDVIEQLPPKALQEFFCRLGVRSSSNNGYLYPRSHQAGAIRDALISKTKELCVSFAFKEAPLSLEKKEDFFFIKTKNNTYKAACCILATGGMAAPKTGSDGSGYALAAALGHSTKKPLPALVPLVSTAKWCKETAGVRAEGCVSLFVEGRLVAEEAGEIQFTDYGISGIPVFQISRYAAVALSQGQKVEARLNLLSEFSFEEIKEGLLKDIAQASERKTFEQILSGWMNAKLAGMLCRELKLSEQPAKALLKKRGEEIVANLTKSATSLSVPISATRSFDQAQTTCGGIPLEEVDSDLQSKKVRGLFFAGEILDVDGKCGGYNLHWAFSSAMVAAKAAAKECHGN